MLVKGEIPGCTGDFTILDYDSIRKKLTLGFESEVTGKKSIVCRCRVQALTRQERGKPETSAAAKSLGVKPRAAQDPG